MAHRHDVCGDAARLVCAQWGVFVRHVAIYSGGDWNDASVCHVQVPEGVDLDAAKKAWRVWYETHYLPEYRASKKPKFIDFPMWLKQFYGATDDDMIEEYEYD